MFANPKVTTGFLVGLAGAVIVAVLGFVAYEHSTDVSLAAPKAWEMRTFAVGKARASLRTVWREERMSYQLRVEPFPVDAAAAAKSPTSIQKHFTIEFLDADGFRLLSHSIEARDLRLVDHPDGTVVAIEARGDRQMSRDVYRRAERWEIRWSFD